MATTITTYSDPHQSVSGHTAPPPPLLAFDHLTAIRDAITSPNTSPEERKQLFVVLQQLGISVDALIAAAPPNSMAVANGLQNLPALGQEQSQQLHTGSQVPADPRLAAQKQKQSTTSPQPDAGGLKVRSDAKAALSQKHGGVNAGQSQSKKMDNSESFEGALYTRRADVGQADVTSTDSPSLARKRPRSPPSPTKTAPIPPADDRRRSDRPAETVNPINPTNASYPQESAQIQPAPVQWSPRPLPSPRHHQHGLWKQHPQKRAHGWLSPTPGSRIALFPSCGIEKAKVRKGSHRASRLKTFMGGWECVV
ncbi:uncharacterized protein EV422DRAFT_165487 [Fimicolochytrium jonesii]|uniref:uncharacterized protein n=1 Tax=Fimicolochytrium jonesii TaxID=1396493 RepID=UPI0022FE0139|nr:uncharacterized protein EV422DRAFT_165487 [Fimicolochytrium jonesii]KAI8818796.1 hypothetical protein EV422DRAFT_165487 [Fimicolochytrium jonesii]